MIQSRARIRAGIGRALLMALRKHSISDLDIVVSLWGVIPHRVGGHSRARGVALSEVHFMSARVLPEALSVARSLLRVTLLLSKIPARIVAAMPG